MVSASLAPRCAFGCTAGGSSALDCSSARVAGSRAKGSLRTCLLAKLKEEKSRMAAAGNSKRRDSVLGIFILSGVAGLIYEIVWARQLVLVFGNTTQAVATILTGFFAGMAIGSVLGGRLADRVRSPLRLYGVIELVLVGIVLATPVSFRLLHEFYRSAYGWLETAPGTLTLIRFGLPLIALAPATILMGSTLPILSRFLARRRDELGGAFGNLYVANTS